MGTTHVLNANTLCNCVSRVFIKSIYLSVCSSCVMTSVQTLHRHRKVNKSGGNIYAVTIMSICQLLKSESDVGLARTAPPTNTNFRLTFLLTRLQEALYEDLPV